MAQVDLREIETLPKRFKADDKSKLKKENEKLNAKIIEYQKQMFAQEEYSLLIILQGMDAAGKSGAVRKTFMGINPAGAQVHSFKVPSKEELSHDFLWRIHKKCPAKGMMHIFDRSHYEDLLVPYIDGRLSEKDIATRATHINNFEKMLEDSGTIVLKFYLHI